MPHIDLTASFQDTTGAAAPRTFCMQTTDPNAVIAIESGASGAASSGVTIGHLTFKDPQVQIVSGAKFVRYRVLSGTVSAVWLDADADPAVGPAGANQGAAWDKPSADAQASDATSAHYFFRADRAVTISAVHYLPDASLTSNNTNYATLTVSTEDGAGGAVGTAASQTTKTTGGSGSWTAGTPVALTLGAAISLTAGQVLKVAIAKTAAGVVVPAGRLQVAF